MIPIRRLFVFAACAAALLLNSVPARPAQFGRPPARSIAVRLAHGGNVNALYVESAAKPAAAVVLVPMLGRGKEDWQPLVDRLVDAGITSLAVDLPGVVAPSDPKELSSWHTVVGGAVDYLFTRAEVRGSAIGIAGASLGANLAVVAAAADTRVRSVALISPSLDYRGVRIDRSLRDYGDRPALLLASLKDPYAARSARELAAGGGGLREVLWSEIPAHGTELLTRQPELTRSLADWFQRTLG